MNMAYRYVAVVVLLAEADFNADKLNLPIQRPISETQVTQKLLNTPRMARDGAFGGRIDLPEYSFAEGGSSPYHVVIRLDRDGYSAYPYGSLPIMARSEKLSHEKSVIGTNEAYQLATNWFTAIDVDVQELEKTN